MKTINLHYAKVDLDNEDIPKFEFKSHFDLIQAVEFLCSDTDCNCVWLLSKENNSDIFISENHESIIDFLKNKSGWNEHADYFLQAYKTFNEAYEVALMIIESFSQYTL